MNREDFVKQERLSEPVRERSNRKSKRVQPKTGRKIRNSRGIKATRVGR